MKILTILSSVFLLTMAVAIVPAVGEQETGDITLRCLECHGEMEADHASSVHRDVPCLECHVQAVEEDHEQMAQVDCSRCHAPHDEKVIHDAHTRVTCRACHLSGGVPVNDPGSGTIIVNGGAGPGTALQSHQSIQPGNDEHCGKCHVHGNTLGTSTAVLPAKGVTCMPCHAATLSMGDATTWVPMILFLAGMIGLCSLWFSGEKTGRIGKKKSPEAQLKPGILFKILLEVVLLKKLFQRSPSRWTIHALIFFPVLFRLALGLITLLLSLLLPGWAMTQALMDKNNAFHGVFFDITGLMLLVGSAIAMAGRKKSSSEAIASSLPEPGWGMPLLIFLMVLDGFILEGLRIAMTGWPEGSGWAFSGYGISLMFNGMTGLADVYGYLWYSHAILVAVFIALIPFTRMIHIITAPIALVFNALSREEDGTGNKL